MFSSEPITGDFQNFFATLMLYNADDSPFFSRLRSIIAQFERINESTTFEEQKLCLKLLLDEISGCLWTKDDFHFYGMGNGEGFFNQAETVKAELGKRLRKAISSKRSFKETFREAAFHPSILTYCDTVQTDRLPLILVIGREPNCSFPVIHTVGAYDFAVAPRCGFWNMAVKLCQGPTGFDQPVSALKKKFAMKRASPICFSDIYAQGINHSTKSKDNMREPGDVERKIAGIFGIPHFSERIKIVLLSGLRGKLGAETMDIIHRTIPGQVSRYEIPFLYPGNWTKIRRELENGHDLLHDIDRIMDEFYRI